MKIAKENKFDKTETTSATTTMLRRKGTTTSKTIHSE